MVIIRLIMLVVVTATSFLSGCVWHDYNSPKIEGVVIHQGQALAGVKVALDDGSRESVTATTDEQGHFSLNPQGEWSVFIPIGPQDRFLHWSVIIYPTGTERIAGYEGGGTGGFFSGYSSSDRVNLLCDIALADESADKPQGDRICRAVPAS